MKQGAFDFLTKPVDGDKLVAAVQAALERNAQLRSMGAETDALRQRYGSLTPREREVMALLVDVNDRVRKGQLLVELDTAKLNDQLTKSRATLSAAQAKVAQTVVTVKESQASLARLEEVSRLSGGKVPAKSELDAARATLERAQADESSARASVVEAQAGVSSDATNLSKASIRSPIDGVVLTRSVEPGNAVAASLQAVTLFNVAEDLSKLRLQVNVDEADVGSVKVGQKASFTVSAHPSRKSPATITRVAYRSPTTENA
eukprot:gene26437-29870_t